MITLFRSNMFDSFICLQHGSYFLLKMYKLYIFGFLTSHHSQLLGGPILYPFIFKLLYFITCYAYLVLNTCVTVAVRYFMQYLKPSFDYPFLVIYIIFVYYPISWYLTFILSFNGYYLPFYSYPYSPP